MSHWRSQKSPDPLGLHCDETPSQRAGRPWWRRLIADYWPLLVIPIALTIVFAEIEYFLQPTIILRVFLAFFMISGCIGGSIMLAYAFFGKRIRAVRPVPLQALVHLGVLVLGLIVGTESSTFLFGVIPLFDDFGGIERGSIYRVGAVIVAVMWTIELVYHRLKARAAAVELREANARRDALKAQLSALQARTDPHFLYNSLNTVASLIDEDPQKAERALERLSDLFRYALDGSRRERVALREELEVVRGYLEVQELRLGDRFRYRVDVDESALDVPVPPLLLQPVVENAVVHGVSPLVEGGTVEVFVSRANGRVMLRVEDDGPGLGHSTPSKGSGTALRDLTSRLEMLYGERGSIQFDQSKFGGCRVTIRVPVDEPGGEED